MLTDNVLDLIGNTPLVRLRGENIYAKAEFLNPGGSIKDRVALAMIEGAERDGRLQPDSIIVEPTSGNTGIGVALVGRLKGYTVRIVMPEGMSEERKKIIRALGAELILTPDEESIGGAVERVAADGGRGPARLRPAAVREPRQSPLPLRDRPPASCGGRWTARSTASWPASAAAARCRASASSSRSTSPACSIVAVEPKNVSALLGHEPGLHQIQGIGDGFIPAVLDVSLVDEVIEVTDEDAIETTRQLGRDLGLLVGISSGANVWAARQLAKRDPGQHRHRPARPRRTLLQHRAACRTVGARVAPTIFRGKPSTCEGWFGKSSVLRSNERITEHAAQRNRNRRALFANSRQGHGDAPEMGLPSPEPPVAAATPTIFRTGLPVWNDSSGKSSVPPAFSPENGTSPSARTRSSSTERHPHGTRRPPASGRRRLGRTAVGLFRRLAPARRRAGQRRFSGRPTRLPGVVCSRVGRDPLGDELVDFLAGQELATDWIQRDAEHPTGTVTVDTTRADHPEYTIHEHVAWDHLEFDAALEGFDGRRRGGLFRHAGPASPGLAGDDPSGAGPRVGRGASWSATSIFVSGGTTARCSSGRWPSRGW